MLLSVHKFYVVVDQQISYDSNVEQIMRDNPRDRSSHARAISVLELLGSYSWGTKVVIVLVALAKCYGEFWLILQLCAAGNPLALSIARLRGLGNSSRIVESVERRFKALRYLFDKMVDVAKNMAEFEILPEQYIMLDFEAMAGLKTYMHMAAYWVIRSSVACASQITSMCAMNSEQMHVSLSYPLEFPIFFCFFVYPHIKRMLTYIGNTGQLL